MATNPKIVGALQKFKLDVYQNLTSKEVIKKFLIETLGLEVWSGQKRLVVFDKENPNVVFKIAYSMQGIEDNINEVACSNKLRMLRDQRYITQDDYELFAEAALVNGDPFVIVQQGATNFVQDPDFIRWFQANRGKHASFNENHMFANFVVQDPNLLACANRQQAILAEYFHPSDCTITREPKNFCLRRDSQGRKKLVLIDMGSIIPNLVRGNYIVRPVCPKCGQTRHYVPYMFNPGMTLDEAMNLDGMYLCKNKDCVDYYQNIKNIPLSYENKDSYVFSKYISDNFELVRGLRAVDGNFFIPNTRISTKMDYLNAVRQTLGWSPSGEKLNDMYRNYMFAAAGFILSAHSAAINEFISQVMRSGQLPTFQNYQAAFCRLLMSRQETVDNITNKVAALTYISILTSRDSDVAIFDILNRPDYSQFVGAIARYRIDNGNAMAIFQCLNAQ